MLLVLQGFALLPQQLLIQLTNLFEGLFELVEVVQPTPDQRDLCRTEAQLAGLSAGVDDVENPQRVTLTAVALGAAAGVADGAFEQGAADDVCEGRDLASELATGGGELFLCHLSR